jgi:hypothetical protein
MIMNTYLLVVLSGQDVNGGPYSRSLTVPGVQVKFHEVVYNVRDANRLSFFPVDESANGLRLWNTIHMGRR